jgi:hypothetical protein
MKSQEALGSLFQTNLTQKQKELIETRYTIKDLIRGIAEKAKSKEDSERIEILEEKVIALSKEIITDAFPKASFPPHTMECLDDPEVSTRLIIKKFTFPHITYKLVFFVSTLKTITDLCMLKGCYPTNTCAEEFISPEDFVLL